MKRSRIVVLFGGLTLASALAGAACDEVPSDTTSTTTTTTSTTTSSSSTTSSGGTGGTMGTGGTGGSGGSLDCYPNPMTHVEIINACTDAQKIDAMPVLPLLEPDGGLPPLP
jgi:hypothetical protein